MSLFAGPRSSLICSYGRVEQEKMLPGVSVGGKKILLSLANTDKHKLSFPLPAQRQVFFPSTAPSSFFFLLPSAAHNSEQYMMAALKHWSGFRAGQDSSPSALCVEYCTHFASATACGRKKMPPPPSFFQTGSCVFQGFFPSLLDPSTNDFLFSFFLFNVPLWCNMTTSLKASIRASQSKSSQLRNATLSNGSVFFRMPWLKGSLAHF